MEGEVRGRTEEQVFFVTEKFLQNTKKVKIPIAGKTVERKDVKIAAKKLIS